MNLLIIFIVVWYISFILFFNVFIVYFRFIKEEVGNSY